MNVAVGKQWFMRCNLSMEVPGDWAPELQTLFSVDAHPAFNARRLILLPEKLQFTKHTYDIARYGDYNPFMSKTEILAPSRKPRVAPILTERKVRETQPWPASI